MWNQFHVFTPPTIRRGNGEESGTRIGHNKPTKSYNGVLYLYGLGCKKWNNCFTCPYPECTWEYGSAPSDAERNNGH